METKPSLAEAIAELHEIANGVAKSNLIRARQIQSVAYGLTSRRLVEVGELNDKEQRKLKTMLDYLKPHRRYYPGLRQVLDAILAVAEKGEG